MEKDCWKCVNFNKSIHMILEDDVLYNCWCKVGNVESEQCDKFEVKEGEQNR